MKVILKENNKYILRLDRGEELVESLIKFCEENGIKAGWFLAIGAVSEVTLSHYDLDTKKYSDKEYKEKLEIISLTGNIAKMPARSASPARQPDGSLGGGHSDAGGADKTIIHTHGSFSNPEMQVVAGHVKRLIVGPTCEIVLEKMNGKIEREFSEEIGLNLMK